MSAQLSIELPKRFRSLCDWQILYSTKIHGISMNTFYSKVMHKSPSLIVVEDTLHHIFGGFATEEWKVDTKYYGSGESFMFKAHPTMKIYPWSKLNNFFQSASVNFISFGGSLSSEGGHALWLDQDFHYGSSKCSETYLNDILSGEADFKCIGIEVWGFTAY